MRSPGTAPPSGAKRTGRSLLMPRIGIAGPRRRPSGTLNLTEVSLLEAEPAALGLAASTAMRGRALFLVVGIHRARDVGGLQFAAADRRHHLLDRGARQPRQRAVQLFVGIGDLGALEQRARRCAGRARHIACAPPPRVARRIAARALPVTTIDSQAAGGAALRLRGDDLDLVAVDISDISGAILPLILQPTAVLPTSVCTA